MGCGKHAPKLPSQNSKTTIVFHTTRVILIEFGSLTDDPEITLVLKTQVLINACQKISHKNKSQFES